MKKTKDELYLEYIAYIKKDLQRERVSVNRRMFQVLLWCLVFPVLFTGLLLLLVQAGVLPAYVRGYTDWLILFFPVGYSIFFLGWEVLRDLPGVFRKGGIANNLDLATQESHWRRQVCEGLGGQVAAEAEDWVWIARSFEMDLDGLRARNRYLTVLAGAVFVLLMNGLDQVDSMSLSTTDLSPRGLFGVIESASDHWYQMLTLAIFLALFYLAGSQIHRAFERYLNCARLMGIPQEKRR